MADRGAKEAFVRLRAPHVPARVIVAPAVLLAGILALSACGSGSGGGGGSEATPTPVPPTGPTATPLPTPPPDPTPTPGPTADPSPPPLRLTLVADGLESPVFLAADPSDGNRLFAVEQTGRIRTIENGNVLDEPFLDLSGAVSCCQERGLLGLAFHPSYAENGRFFVDYTNLDGDTEVVEFAREEPRRADPAPVRVLVEIDQPFGNHNGGMLAFAPDGTLIVGAGDGGGAGDPQNNARNLASKLGKLLRLDVDRHPAPPPGNVPGADPDVWDYGLRNPWRFSFDRATGDLWIGDVGQNRFEEIDLAPAGAAHLDFGWPVSEGDACFRPMSGCDTTGLTLPIHTYDRASGCSVTGGYVYRGGAIPGLVGWYLFGDYCSNRVWALRRGDAGAAEVVELTPAIDPDGQVSGLSSFGEDRDGDLYVVSLSGEIFRIDPVED